VKVGESLAFEFLSLNTGLHLDLEEAFVPEPEEVNGGECPACGEKRALTKSGRVRAWPRVLVITHKRSMYDFEGNCAWAREIHVTGGNG
jgi:ubiquitin C-terminal hydrolase